MGIIVNKLTIFQITVQFLGSTRWLSRPPLERCTHLGSVVTGSLVLVPLTTEKAPPPSKAPSWSPVIQWIQARHSK